MEGRGKIRTGKQRIRAEFTCLLKCLPCWLELSRAEEGDTHPIIGFYRVRLEGEGPAEGLDSFRKLLSLGEGGPQFD